MIKVNGEMIQLFSRHFV